MLEVVLLLSHVSNVVLNRVLFIGFSVLTVSIRFPSTFSDFAPIELHRCLPEFRVLHSRFLLISPIFLPLD